MPISDADLAGTCNTALAAIDLSGTIFGSRWATDSVIWPNQATVQARINTLPRIEVGFAGIEPEPLSLSEKGVNRRRWLYEVNVVTKTGIGEIKALEVADKVAEAFYMGRRLEDGAWVRARPSIGPGFQDDVEWHLPVVVRLQAFVIG